MSTVNKVIIDVGMRKASAGYIRRSLRTNELEYQTWVPEDTNDSFRVGIRENTGDLDYAIVFGYTCGLKEFYDSLNEIRTAVANNESW